MKPKVSVIIPVYNTGEILRNTLDSILSQTFADFEVTKKMVAYVMLEIMVCQNVTESM